MRWIFIILILLTGCLPRTIIAPSESLYYEANKYFEDKNYPLAIEKYKQFIEKYPQSGLLTSAKLNLGMAYCYTEDFTGSLQILKTININDENMKKFINDIIKTCEEKTQKTLTAEKITELTQKEPINISVKDVYINNLGMLVIIGEVDKPSDVYTNGTKAQMKETKEFTISTLWKKGDPVQLTAISAQGEKGELDYFPDTDPPDKPAGLNTRNVTSNSVELEWDDNTEKDMAGYKLYYQLKGGGSSQEIPEIIKDNNYEIVGLQNLISGANKTFQFYLRAVDKTGNYSNPSAIHEETLP